MKRITVTLLVLAALVSGLGCQPPPPHPGGGGGSIGDPVDNSAGDPLDPTNLPLGDYHVTSAPQRGEIMSCQSAFMQGGAGTDGPWIDDDGTWDSTTKLHVQGAVSWPQAVFSVSLQGAQRV